jgi:putative flippase GtrA
MTTARLSPSGPPIDVETDTDGIENLSSVPGTNVTEALDFLESVTNQALFDEFVGGTSSAVAASNDTGLIGDLGWNFVTSGGQAIRNSTADFVGAYDITANASQISAIYLITTNAVSGGLVNSSIQRLSWRVKPGTDGANLIGFGVSPGTVSLGNDAITFQASSASAFWRVVTRTGGVNTNVLTTTVPWNTGALFDLVMVRNSATNWTFFINGALVATVTSGLTAVRLVPAAQMQATAAGADTLTVDTQNLNYATVPLV